MDVADAADTKGKMDYVRGLAADAGAGTYQFKDGDGTTSRALRTVGGGGATLEQVTAAVVQVLTPVTGFDAAAHADLAGRIATLLHRMLTRGEAALEVLLSLSAE